MKVIKLAKLYQKNANAILDNLTLICIYVWDAWGGIHHGVADTKRIKQYNLTWKI